MSNGSRRKVTTSTRGIRSSSSPLTKRTSSWNLPADGVLAGVKAKPDDVIPVTEIIAYILAARRSAAGQGGAPARCGLACGRRCRRGWSSTRGRRQAAGPCKVRATPLARRMAQDLGVDLKQPSGRGPRGRIHKADVLAFQKPQPAVERATAPAPVPAAWFQRRRAVPTPAGPPPPDTLAGCPAEKRGTFGRPAQDHRRAHGV